MKVAKIKERRSMVGKTLQYVPAALRDGDAASDRPMEVVPAGSSSNDSTIHPLVRWTVPKPEDAKPEAGE